MNDHLKQPVTRWIGPFLLGVVATLLGVVVFGPRGEQGIAFAQAPAVFGARGVLAFPGQLTSQAYGLWMVDVDAGNLWCYQMKQGEGSLKLELIAARSWIHDRYLPNFNVAGPTPDEVAELVDKMSVGGTAPGASSVDPGRAKTGENGETRVP